LYFHGKDRHANSLQYYVSRTLTFSFYVLWPKRIIFILQGQYQYEVNNLNTSE